jgi:hypothetical protein
MREGRVREASIIHAHLAYMHRNVAMVEVDKRMVKTFLVAQMWLRTNYNFDAGDVKTGRWVLSGAGLCERGRLVVDPS